MSQVELTAQEQVEDLMVERREKGICDHWTYFGGYGREKVAICDKPTGHDGDHVYYLRVQEGKGYDPFSWADVYEHHEKRGS